MGVRTWIGAAALVAGIWPMVAMSAGRTEINQSSVDAAGGFPFTITQPGSYVLTSDLAVPVDTDALILATDGVALDLNGFAIRGPSTCEPGGLCAIGVGDGISRTGGADPPGNRVSVSGGAVSGFTGTCVLLGDEAAVANTLVHDCGFRGISVGERSLISGNRVLKTGLEGIALGIRSAFANNVVALTGIGGGGNPAILGGTATGGNVCDDGSCSAYAPMRRFYVTVGQVSGDQPDEPGTCAPGFHFASFWEIHDPSHLKYDTSLGATAFDSGLGPPSAIIGWVRSGNSGMFGGSNCSGWTDDTSSFAGAAVFLPTDALWANPAERTSAWQYAPGNCDSPRRVWCVED